MNKEYIWLEIKDITGLKEIISTLNKYHNMHRSSCPPSEAHKFREKLVLTTNRRIKLYAKKFGDYEYLIVAILKFKKKELKDTWIHIDGISHERDSYSRAGNTKHEVFSITCMKDLYDKGKAVNFELAEAEKPRKTKAAK